MYRKAAAKRKALGGAVSKASLFGRDFPSFQGEISFSVQSTEHSRVGASVRKSVFLPISGSWLLDFPARAAPGNVSGAERDRRGITLTPDLGGVSFGERTLPGVILTR